MKNWSQSILYRRGDESTRDLHVLNVYEDPEFDADIKRLIGDNGEFIADVIASQRTIPGHDLHDIASKYYITLDEVMHYFVGLRDTMPLPRSRPFRIDWDEYGSDDLPYFTLVISKNIRKEDFMELGELIVRRPSRRKPATNPKLVYAIFKARQQQRKFSEIFKDYQNGILVGYTGSGTQFKSEDSLERYYRKYDPKKMKPELLYEEIPNALDLFRNKHADKDT